MLHPALLKQRWLSPRAAKRSLACIGGVFFLALLAPDVARGGTLTGKLKLPPRFSKVAVVGAPVFWKLPNPLMPLAPPPLDPRRRMAIVLEGPAKAAPTDRNTTLRLVDARFDPPLLVIAPGTKAVVENADVVMHLIESTTTSPLPMKGRSVAPGDRFTHVFAKAGVYRLHCSEVPHMRATVFVTDQPVVALPRSDGSFTFEGIPAERYLLRVWHDGEWIHSMGVRVRGRTSVDVEIPSDSEAE